MGPHHTSLYTDPSRWGGFVPTTQVITLTRANGVDTSTPNQSIQRPEHYTSLYTDPSLWGGYVPTTPVYILT